MSYHKDAVGFIDHATNTEACDYLQLLAKDPDKNNMPNLTLCHKDTTHLTDNASTTPKDKSSTLKHVDIETYRNDPVHISDNVKLLPKALDKNNMPRTQDIMIYHKDTTLKQAHAVPETDDLNSKRAQINKGHWLDIVLGMVEEVCGEDGSFHIDDMMGLIDYMVDEALKMWEEGA